MDKIKEKVEDLIRILNQANYDYFVNDNPSLSDYQYDELINELKKIEEQYPELISQLGEIYGVYIGEIYDITEF